MSGSLWSHGLQHDWLPYPSSSPRICSKSCPLSEWCSLTISSSVVPFSFCLQSFSESESFPMSQLFASGAQSMGASASAIVLPMNNQVDFLLDWLVWSSCCPGDSQESSSTTIWNYQFFSTTTGRTVFPSKALRRLSSSSFSFWWFPGLWKHNCCLHMASPCVCVYVCIQISFL